MALTYRALVFSSHGFCVSLDPACLMDKDNVLLTRDAADRQGLSGEVGSDQDPMIKG